MLEKRTWAARHADHLRQSLVLEPRGHADLSGAVLTEPALPGAHAGILFFDAAGFGVMSGHGVIAAATIAVERGLVMPGGDGRTIVFDTPAGTVRAVADVTDGHVDRVTFTNVPAFVLHAGLPVQLAGRHLRADVAYGGVFYAIVDAEAAGLSLDVEHAPELRRAGLAIRDAVERTREIAHPSQPALVGLAGTVFTGPPHGGDADLRSTAVRAGGAVDRSPSGTATSAVMAVIDAMGLLGDDRPFVHEGLVGTRFEGRVTGRSTVGDDEAIVTDVSGSAWITGDHAFVIDERDPLKRGFSV